MTFLELDVQGSDHVCRNLMDDLTAIEDESAQMREFIGNAHCVQFTPEHVLITANQSSQDATTAAANTLESTTASGTVIERHTQPPDELPFQIGLKRFREVLEDWEAFILYDQFEDNLSDNDYP